MVAKTWRFLYDPKKPPVSPTNGKNISKFCLDESKVMSNTF